MKSFTRYYKAKISPKLKRAYEITWLWVIYIALAAIFVPQIGHIYRGISENLQLLAWLGVLAIVFMVNRRLARP